jgi:hypothetical protein
VAKLSPEQIYAVAREAGLSKSAALYATAIALAESGGETTAHNPNPPDNSYGLWQINMIGNMGPERRRQLGISSNEELKDPRVNARAMALVSNNGANWRPWSVYTSGKYREHWQTVLNIPTADWREVAKGIGGIPGKVAGAVGGAAGDALGGALGSLVEPITAGARNIALTGAFTALGLGLVLMGGWRAVSRVPGVPSRVNLERARKVVSLAATKGAA